MLATDLLTVGEVAGRSGFAASALRYYERLGLIAAARTAGGQRRYERNVLRRLAFVRAARNVGLSLDEVAAALDALPGGRFGERAAPMQRRRFRQDGCEGEIGDTGHTVGGAVVVANEIAFRDEATREDDVGKETRALVRHLRREDRLARASKNAARLGSVEQERAQRIGER